MADLKQMSRVLYHHDWTSAEDWARNIAQLAELTDEEISELPRCCRRDTAGAPGGETQPSIPVQPNHPDRLAWMWRRLAPRRQVCDVLRTGWRFSLRRA